MVSTMPPGKGVQCPIAPCVTILIPHYGSFGFVSGWSASGTPLAG